MNSKLHIYNTLSRQKDLFQSIEPLHVRMYVCGMTVYDYCHLGHARVMVVFDLWKRWLRALGYRVTYVRNITDIDDKIIRRALEMSIPIRDLTDRFIHAMHEDADALGIERPDAEPRATEYVAEMQAMISTLMQKRMAYRDASGDVNFSVRAFPGYGRLSGKSLDELQAGERVLVSDSKQDPLDFVLWKSAKPDEPDDAKWDAPFGVGRPGWHIECSAMSCKLLGNEFDIHGGGADLQFPHHENEIAQSVGATGEGFARFWVHNGFVRVVRDGQEDKMSKSLGNFFTIRDLLQQYDAEVLRFFILRAQYRSPLTYSSHHVDDAKASLGRLYKAVGDVQPGAENLDWTLDYESRFAAAMNDDLNTPEAVAVLFEMAAEILRGEGGAHLPVRLKRLAEVLGLLGRTEQAFRHSAGHGQADDQEALAARVEAKMAERAAAKAARDFAKADEIRKALLDDGIVLEDIRGGETTWRRL